MQLKLDNLPVYLNFCLFMFLRVLYDLNFDFTLDVVYPFVSWKLLNISAVCFSAPIVWNELSEQVRTSATRDIFSGRLNAELFACGTVADVLPIPCLCVIESCYFYHFVSINYVTLNKWTLLLLLLVSHKNSDLFHQICKSFFKWKNPL